MNVTVLFHGFFFTRVYARGDHDYFFHTAAATSHSQFLSYTHNTRNNNKKQKAK